MILYYIIVEIHIYTYIYIYIYTLVVKPREPRPLSRVHLGSRGPSKRRAQKEERVGGKQIYKTDASYCLNEATSSDVLMISIMINESNKDKSTVIILVVKTITTKTRAPRLGPARR